MVKAELTKRAVTFLKNVSIICGSLLVVLALVSNLLGFSISEGFSWNQLVIVLIGIVLILGGIDGSGISVHCICICNGTVSLREEFCKHGANAI